jgi:hypothetical protein
MTEGNETTENVGALSHSQGDPDPVHRDREREGSDVGGPAQATESTTEEALTGTSTVGEEDDQHSQATDPS